MSQGSTQRKPEYSIDKIFLDRWSPRSFQPVDIPLRELLSLLEAGKWAASAYNSQPWRFLYARRGTPHWDKYLNLLNEFNRGWAKNASAFILLVSKTTMVSPANGETMPNKTHSFSAGTAMAHIMLQAVKSGWATHAMSGFDYLAARRDLNVPEEYFIDALMVVGKQGEKSALPEALQAREQPSPRMKLDDIAFEGSFRK